MSAVPGDKCLYSIAANTGDSCIFMFEDSQSFRILSLLRIVDLDQGVMSPRIFIASFFTASDMWRRPFLDLSRSDRRREVSAEKQFSDLLGSIQKFPLVEVDFTTVAARFSALITH